VGSFPDTTIMKQQLLTDRLQRSLNRWSHGVSMLVKCIQLNNGHSLAIRLPSVRDGKNVAESFFRGKSEI
jgi:hypothetical protein